MRTATITVSASFDMGHRLPNHQGLCRNLHGHLYRVEATVYGTIKDNPGAPDDGMVVDFSSIKSALRAQIAERDHRFMLWNLDPLLDTMYNLPGILIVPYVPTAENIAFALLLSLPHDVVSVKLWETPTSFCEVSR
jgi:6-pyruvoyltetrahydropterin/6-carboxytetrahydropterin synthase